MAEVYGDRFTFQGDAVLGGEGPDAKVVEAVFHVSGWAVYYMMRGWDIFGL